MNASDLAAVKQSFLVECEKIMENRGSVYASSDDILVNFKTVFEMMNGFTIKKPSDVALFMEVMKIVRKVIRRKNGDVSNTDDSVDQFNYMILGLALDRELDDDCDGEAHPLDGTS